MKIGLLQTEQRFESRNDKVYGIQTYGQNNDYPQRVMDIVAASVSAVSCNNNYKKFINGNGFADMNFKTAKLNRKEQTADYILEQISSDLAMFGGFVLHFNYNANYKISEIQHVPFETVRFEKLDDDGNFNRVALHPDWARQFTNLRRWKKDDITLINLFDPAPDKITEQCPKIKGTETLDLKEYNGQIFYYSNEGDKVYPIPPFAAALTDMNTEKSIANILNRNAANNFLPAGMLVDKKNSDQSKEQEDDTEENFLKFQGSDVACKMMYIQVGSDEEKPEFIPFRTNNYDKEFQVSKNDVKDSIGRIYNQPAILRAEAVSGNFGADLMSQAYSYYNSVTKVERNIIQRVFEAIMLHWWQQETFSNFKINPLVYDSEL